MATLVEDPEDCDQQEGYTSFNVTPQSSAIHPSYSVSKKELGCLTDCYHLQPEDPEPEPDGKEHYAQWQDPFRMSVLNFQHRALDKLAEVLTIYLKTKKSLKAEKYEDVQALIHCLKQNAKEYATDLGYEDHYALIKACKTLRDARTAFAHQKYNKSPISEEDEPQENLPEGYHTTRTFKHTSDVIADCLTFTGRVKEIRDLSSDKVGYR